MIEDTVSKIEERIRNVSRIDDQKKGELLKLVRELSEEVSELAKTRSEQAESISRFTEVSTHEAVREEQDPDLLKLGLDGLARSVEGFEVEHPRLVEAVNSLCMMLSGIGI